MKRLKLVIEVDKDTDAARTSEPTPLVEEVVLWAEYRSQSKYRGVRELLFNNLFSLGLCGGEYDGRTTTGMDHDGGVTWNDKCESGRRIEAGRCVTVMECMMR